MVLRDAAGLVVDSLNYGGLVDPWAAEGYQAKSGAGQSGCRAPSPSDSGGRGRPVLASTTRSAGRFPDGADTDSNCNDFLLQAATTLPIGSAAGATNLKVTSVAELAAGQTILVDAGANRETAVISAVGTAGGTTVSAPAEAGATAIHVTSAFGFAPGQSVTIDNGGNAETAVVSSVGFGRGSLLGPTINFTAPLKTAHAAGAQVSGSGITLAKALTRPHENGAPIASDLPTPGAPNRYSRQGQ
jgi:hypothetical protein